MESGGKNPVLVFDEFNVDQAVNHAVFCCFISAGRSCVRASRHLAQQSVHEEIVEKLASRLTVRASRAQLGAVISDKQGPGAGLCCRGHVHLVAESAAAAVPGLKAHPLYSPMLMRACAS